MNKDEAIADALKQHARQLKTLAALPDETIEGVSVVNSVSGDVSLHSSLITMEELYDILHQLKKLLGDYKMSSYWIPYDGTICVDYMFGATRYWASFSGNVPTVLSSGKCSVVSKTSQTIVCGVGS